MHANALIPETLREFWWFYALSGGFAMLFATVLLLSSALLGTLFLDPVMLVILSVLLGFYVVIRGVLLGVAAAFSAEHCLGFVGVLVPEAVFATGLGLYLAVSLFLTNQTFAILAGVHAAGVGLFQCAAAIRLREDRPSRYLLWFGSMLSLIASCIFFAHLQQQIKHTTRWLAGFEIVCGLIAIMIAARLHRSDLGHDVLQGAKWQSTRTSS